VSDLARRLGRLEDGSRPCSSCGLDPLAPPIYKIVWEDDDPSPEETNAGSSTPCLRCGQRQRVVVDWDDVP
jgi:hypothetical protein